MSFKIAGSLALQNCVKEAQPYLLEPIMSLEVLVPEDQLGDVLADLNSRRGRVLGMESSGAGLQRIRAHVPMAETFRYATDLRSMTGGRGTFSATLLGYEQCPTHIAQKVIAAHEAETQETAAARWPAQPERDVQGRDAHRPSFALAPSRPDRHAKPVDRRARLADRGLDLGPERDRHAGRRRTSPFPQQAATSASPATISAET